MMKLFLIVVAGNFVATGISVLGMFVFVYIRDRRSQ